MAHWIIDGGLSMGGSVRNFADAAERAAHRRNQRLVGSIRSRRTNVFLVRRAFSPCLVVGPDDVGYVKLCAQIPHPAILPAYLLVSEWIHNRRRPGLTMSFAATQVEEPG